MRDMSKLQHEVAAYGPIKIFSGTSNQQLTTEICKYLDVPVGEVMIDRFSDGEINLRVMEHVRGCDAYVIQSTSPPVNDNLVELLVMIDALRRASAQRITAVIPYFGYARQDRKVIPRVPITSKLIANLLCEAGADRVLVVDLHAGQIQGFFDIPVDHLLSAPVLAKYFLEKTDGDAVVVSPDAGGVARAREFAKRLKASLAIVDKRRPKANQAEVMNVIGDVKNMDVIIFDDMIDTAGTLSSVARALKNEGAKRVWAAASHGVLSGNAIKNLIEAPIDEIVITNTIHLPKEKIIDKIKVLSIGSLLGEAIKRIHINMSVSSLFE
ncbi:MAG: ribose-phosphate pyrophosphokinase [Elusimicrobiota bacterium]